MAAFAFAYARRTIEEEGAANPRPLIPPDMRVRIRRFTKLDEVFDSVQ